MDFPSSNSSHNKVTTTAVRRGAGPEAVEFEINNPAYTK